MWKILGVIYYGILNFNLCSQTTSSTDHWWSADHRLRTAALHRKLWTDDIGRYQCLRHPYVLFCHANKAPPTPKDKSLKKEQTFGTQIENDNASGTEPLPRSCDTDPLASPDHTADSCHHSLSLGVAYQACYQRASSVCVHHLHSTNSARNHKFKAASPPSS